MSDVHLRELERRAAQDGDPQAQAQLLRARVRAGTLGQERLELAAYCGHAAARLVVPTMQSVPHELTLWLSGLDRERQGWGRDVSVRAALAMAPAAAYYVDQRYRSSRLPAMAMEAAQAWLDHPCRELEGACHVAHRACDGLGEGTLPAWAAARIASGDPPRSTGWALRLAMVDACGEEPTNEPAVREAVQAALITWALGPP